MAQQPQQMNVNEPVAQQQAAQQQPVFLRAGQKRKIRNVYRNQQPQAQQGQQPQGQQQQPAAHGGKRKSRRVKSRRAKTRRTKKTQHRKGSRKH